MTRQAFQDVSSLSGLAALQDNCSQLSCNFA